MFEGVEKSYNDAPRSHVSAINETVQYAILYDTVRSMKKYIFIAVSLLMLGGAAYLSLDKNSDLTETTDPTNEQTATMTSFFDMEPIVPEAKVSTEEWKTCRNEEAGWEVKYPEDWYVYGEGAYSEHAPIFIRTTPCAGLYVVMSESKNHYDDTPNNGNSLISTASISIRKFNKEEMGDKKKEMKTIEELSTLYTKNRLLGIVALDNSSVKTLWATLTPNESTSFELFHNGHYYRIVMGNFMSEDVQSTILSTFHFLDTTNSTE